MGEKHTKALNLSRGHDVTDRRETLRLIALTAMLCILTLVPRSYKFTNPPIDGQSFRQTLTASIIRNYVERDHNFLHPQVDFLGDNNWFYLEFPLYEYLLALPMMVFGYSEALIRLFNIACGLGTVLLLFHFLSEEGLTREEAAAGAACYAATPIAIFFDRALMMDSFVLMLGTLYLLGLRRWIERGSLRALAAATVALSIALVQKLPVVWPAALFGCYLVVRRKRMRGLLSAGFLICHGVAALSLLSWAVFVWSASHGHMSQQLGNARQWFFGWGTLLRWGVMWHYIQRVAGGFSAAWAALAALGAWLAFRSRQFILLLFALCGLSEFVMFPNLNVIHSYYQLCLLCAVAPLAGLALERLVKAVPLHSAQPALLIACLAGLTWWGFQVARDTYFPLETWNWAAAQELKRIPQNGAELFYIDGSIFPGLHYLAHRRGLIITDGTLLSSGAFKGYNELLVSVSGYHAPVGITHYLGPFRLTAHYHYWEVYTRREP